MGLTALTIVDEMMLLLTGMALLVALLVALLLVVLLVVLLELLLVILLVVLLVVSLLVFLVARSKDEDDIASNDNSIT